MGTVDLIFSVLQLYLISTLFSAGVRCQFQIRTANSSSTNKNRTVSCSPASHLLIRTAYYLTTRPAHSRRCPGVGCGAKDNPNLMSEDVLKIYQYCRGRSHDCDISGVGLENDFAITYYCLTEPLLNPCSNKTLEKPTTQTAMFFNYSRHATDLDVMCQCKVTIADPSNETLYVRALNIFEQTKEMSDSAGDDVLGTKNDSTDDGVDVMGTKNDSTDEEGREEKRKHGPRVLIDNEEWLWEVERGAVPVEWQLNPKDNGSVSLLFERLQGVSFGYIWVDFREQAVQVSCSYTSQPAPTTEIPKPEQKPNVAESDKTMIYVAVAASVAVVLLVVVIVAVAKCRRRRRPSRPKTGYNGPCPDNGMKADGGNNIALEGEYCTINEVGGTRATNGPACPEPPPLYDETSFKSASSQHVPGDGDSGGASHRNSQPLQVKPAPTTPHFMQRSQSTDSRGELKADGPSGNEYGSLCHRPKQAPYPYRSEPVIYDHAGTFVPSEGEEDFHRLHHGVRTSPRVIDNVYDTTNPVKKS